MGIIVIVISSLSAIATITMAISTWKLAKETKRMAQLTNESLSSAQKNHLETIKALHDLLEPISGLIQH
jgi:hypothetical protein